MEKFIKFCKGFAWICFGLYFAVIAYAHAQRSIQNAENDITVVEEDGVRCYAYRQALSCIPNFFPTSIKPANQ